MGTKGERYVPSLAGKVHHDVETEIRRLWLASFDLQDVRLDVYDLTLTTNKRIDRTLNTNRPLIVITRQDTVGGRTVQWATNSDNTLKFKGTAAVTPTTTANTYTAYFFIAISDREALLVSYVTGGNLS